MRPRHHWRGFAFHPLAINKWYTVGVFCKGFIVIVHIKERLADVGLSPYSFAKTYDIHQSTVYAWVTGKIQPKYEMMELLCRVCQCTLDDMFTLERQQ